jgi:hypothetical protein
MLIRGSATSIYMKAVHRSSHIAVLLLVLHPYSTPNMRLVLFSQYISFDTMGTLLYRLILLPTHENSACTLHQHDRRSAV